MIKEAICLIFFGITAQLNYAQNKSADYEIKALLPNWDSTFVSIVLDGETIHADTVRKGAIRFRGQVNTAKEALFILTDGHAKITLPLYVEPGTIIIRDHAPRTAWFDITGTVTNDLLFRFNKVIDSIYPRTFDTTLIYETRRRQYVENFIQQHKESIINLVLFRRFILNTQTSIQEKVTIFNSIDKTIRNTSGGQEILVTLNQILNTSIGMLAPNFSLTDTNNQIITLVGFRGKYVLIDFWASWCAPCREQTPTLRKVYQQFKNKGLIIISISLDTDREKWLAAIKKDEMLWTNLSDLKGWENVAAKQYYINEIPANLLLNTRGFIIEKNLDSNNLLLKLSSIFGGLSDKTID